MTKRKIRAVILAVLGFLVGVFLWFDYWESRPDASWPMVHGVVTDRSMIALGGFVKRPHLTIRTEPNGPSVQAVLTMNAHESVPDTVSFRYSGNPSREVFLEEETSPLTGALLFFGLIVGLRALWPVYERQQLRPRRAPAGRQ